MSRSPWALRPSVVCLVAAQLAGCGTLSPYQEMTLAGAPRSGPATVMPDATAAAAADGLPEGLDPALRSALLAVESQRQQYFDKLDSSAARRSLGAGALYTLGGWALLNGLKAKPSPADTVRTQRLSVATSTLYLGTDFGINASQEAVHAKAYVALTCLMAQSRPLWLLQRDSAEAAAAASEAPNGVRSVQALASSLAALETAINEGYVEVEQYAQGHRPKQMDASSATLVAARYKALDLARQALADGRELEQSLRESGAVLRHRAALIVAATNVDLQKLQKNLPDGVTELGRLRTLYDTLSTLGDSTADAEASTGSETPGTTEPTAPTNTGKATEASLEGSSSPSTQPAATPAAGASAPTTTSSTRRSVVTTDTETTTTDTSTKTAVTRTKAQAQAASAASAASAAAKAATAPQLPPMGNAARATFITRTNNLHALRRPVAQALMQFRASLGVANTHGSCQAVGKAVHIAPSGTQYVKPGATLEFLVSAPLGGIPRVGLLTSAAAGADLDTLLTQRSEGQALRVTLKVPAKDVSTPADWQLWASDPDGVQHERVRIRVLKP